MDLFIVLFIILFFITAIRELEWTVMLILAGLPLYLIRFKIFGLPSTVLEIMILINFTVWLFTRTEFKNFFQGKYKIKDYFKNRAKRIKYPFGNEIIALLAISFISIAIAGFSSASLGIWKAYFFEPLLVFILVLNVFKPSSDTGLGLSLRRILWPLFFSALAVSIIAVMQKFGFLYSPENFWPRVTGPWLYPNALGLFLGPLLPLMAAYIMMLIFNFIIFLGFARSREAMTIFKQYKINKFLILKTFFLLIIFILSIAVIFYARSEGAIIGAIIGLILIPVFTLRKKSKLLISVSRSGVLVILIFVIFSSVFFLKVIPEHKYINSDYNIVNYATDKLLLKDFSGEVRKQQWRETFQMMKHDWRWLFGTGLSRYQVSVKTDHQEGIFFNKERDPDFRRKIVWFDEKYKAEHWQPVEIYMYPHNIILNFWTELGLAGVLLFVWIIGKYFYIGFKQYKANLQISNTRDANASNFNNANRFIILGLIGAMLVIIIHGIVDVPYFKNDLSVMFWVLIAVMSLMNLPKES